MSRSALVDAIMNVRRASKRHTDRLMAIHLYWYHDAPWERLCSIFRVSEAEMKEWLDIG